MFEHEEISNQFIVVNPKGNNELNETGDLHCDLSATGKNTILEAMNSSDLVVHYFLDYTKSELILKSSKNVKHYWDFFGADVYQQLNVFKKNLYGKRTKRWMRFVLSYRFRLEFRSIKYLINGKPTPKRMLLDSFQRIDRLLWYIDEEIDWINTKVKTPEFLYFKHFTFEDVIPFEKCGVNTLVKKILIGNSATLENNHLDVLEMFRENKITDYQVALPLSYGSPEAYKQCIKTNYQAFFGDKFQAQESVLSLEEYYSWLNDFPTAIMLHYRQQALGNLFYLIANGTKIYLSEKNILLKWFGANQIDVFCFEKEFLKDYSQNNLTLDLVKQQNNYSNLKKLLSRESSFITDLLKDFK